MADWVHCNKCFLPPGSGKRFLLTSCGHIYCSSCVGAGRPINCQICGNSCTTIGLSSQMKPDVEVYFTDVKDLLQKYLKQIQQVISFQNEHRVRLAAYNRQQISQVGKVKDELKASAKLLKELQRESAKLKEENVYLKQFLSKESRLTRSDDHQNSSQPKLHLHPTPPSRVTVRTPPVNGHIGIIPRTSSSHGTPSTPANSERSMSSATPPNLTPSTPKAGIDGKVQQGRRYGPYSTPMSLSNSLSRDVSPNSNYGSYHSGSPTNSASSLLSVPFHRPIQLRQEFRHPGLIRKATISPYSPHHRNEALPAEE